MLKTPSSLLRMASRVALRRSVPVTTSASTVAAAVSAARFSQPLSHRSFSSSSSHDDFAPVKKVAAPDDTDEAVKMIADHVKSNPVMLYMKGNPAQPMCGFSAKVVGILQKEGADFSSVNVLDYPAIRDGVKKYSEWPTIPQLYVNAEFIGGCDIVTAMHESGELAELLKEVPKAAE